MTNPTAGINEFMRICCGHCEPQSIVMAGMGRSREARRLREVFAGATLIGVDPLRKYTAFGRRRRQFDRVFLAALWGRNEEVRIWTDYSESESATAYALLEPLPDAASVTVRGWTLDALKRRSRAFWRSPVLLWLDAEGAEAEILAGAGAALDDVTWLNVEVCLASGRDAPDLFAVSDVLRARGFRLAGLHSGARDCRTFDGVYVREAQLTELRRLTCQESTTRKIASRARGLASASQDI